MKQKEKNKQLRNKNGITLIALVVTIIVLIILAGVSISLVLGDNGIITKAKEAKQNTELAKIEEEVQLNETAEYLENLGTETTSTDIKTVEEMKSIEDNYMPSKTTLKDSNDNLIVVPEGFKIATDSGINVTEGIVIEDNDKTIDGKGELRGNQYVWIPVGVGIKKSDGTTVDITLGRYLFADGKNQKDEAGIVFEAGTPILKQSAEFYEEEIGINIKEIKPTTSDTYEYKELKTNRPGVENSGLNIQNATALKLKGFIDSVKANGGYYIARYEASYGVDGKVNSKVSIGTPTLSTTISKTEGMLWNNITQINAQNACKNLYNIGEKVSVNSDLMNSYAWDTAIVYIQKFSEETHYSIQDGKSINEDLSNTGNLAEGVKDEVCKINDMASNTYEWTTEYSTCATSYNALPCTVRGGSYFNGSYYTSSRNSANTTESSYYTFRATLYM